MQAGVDERAMKQMSRGKRTERSTETGEPQTCLRTLIKRVRGKVVRNRREKKKRKKRN